MGHKRPQGLHSVLLIHYICNANQQNKGLGLIGFYDAQVQSKNQGERLTVGGEKRSETQSNGCKTLTKRDFN